MTETPAPGDDRQLRDSVQSATLTLDFNVQAIEAVTVDGPPALMERDLMSPFVWREPDGRYGIMLRAVPRPGVGASDTGVIWAGWCEDGTRFKMLEAPVIVPGPDAHDIGGVEDPTVVQMEGGGYVVYYTGVLADRSTGELSYAEGPSVDRLEKKGVALASSKTQGNTKEATVHQTPDGKWWLLYEYAAEGASRIGLAVGEAVNGPWTELPAPILPREESWDNWHLSTGPVLVDGDNPPVLFYNGATRDARWRIGWAALDEDTRSVCARGIEPLITPPPVADRSDTDIAFAASVVVVEGVIWLYYSLEDRRLARARIRRS